MTDTVSTEDIDAQLADLAARLRRPMLREIRAAAWGRVDRLLDQRAEATRDGRISLRA